MSDGTVGTDGTVVTKQGRGADKGTTPRRGDGTRIRPTKAEWALINSSLATLAVEGKIALTESQVKDCKNELAELGVANVVEAKTTKRGNDTEMVTGTGVTFLEWTDWTSNPVYNTEAVEAFGEIPVGTVLVVKSRERGRPKGTGKKLQAVIDAEVAARAEVQAELDAETASAENDEA